MKKSVSRVEKSISELHEEKNQHATILRTKISEQQVP